MLRLVHVRVSSLLTCARRMYTDKPSCKNNTLETLPMNDNLFTLTAWAPDAPFHGQAIDASSEVFWIGIGGPSIYCPTSLEAVTCPPGDQTVLSAGQGMVSSGVPRAVIKNAIHYVFRTPSFQEASSTTSDPMAHSVSHKLTVLLPFTAPSLA